MTPDDLVSIGTDIYGRPQRLRKPAAEAWNTMRLAASQDQICIRLVSAYRSVEYQIEVIDKLVKKGQNIRDILTRVAAPGFSEHQSGCAVDLTSDEETVLEEEFELTHAFAWLQSNAREHCFYLSYPKDNESGVIYEPWHWCYRGP